MANINQKLELFANHFPVHSYAAKEAIIDAQAEPKGVYWLISGQVRQMIISEEGEELTAHVFEPGSFFPLMWAMNQIPNRHAYEAVVPTELRLIPVEDFLKFLQGEPDILFNLAQRLLHGLNGLLLRVESLSLQNAHKRVISILIYLARHFGERQGDAITIHTRLTHHDIATYTGLARETTSVEISKLEKLGLIGYNGSTLIIHDISRLENLLK